MFYSFSVQHNAEVLRFLRISPVGIARSDESQTRARCNNVHADDAITQALLIRPCSVHIVLRRGFNGVSYDVLELPYCCSATSPSVWLANNCVLVAPSFEPGMDVPIGHELVAACVRDLPLQPDTLVAACTNASVCDALLRVSLN